MNEETKQKFIEYKMVEEFEGRKATWGVLGMFFFVLWLIVFTAVLWAEAWVVMQVFERELWGDIIWGSVVCACFSTWRMLELLGLKKKVKI